MFLIDSVSSHQINDTRVTRRVAQLVQHRTRDPMCRGSNPVRSKRQIRDRFFSESKCCAGSLSVCLTPVCIRTHKNDNVLTLKIMKSMPLFGGLRKHEKIQHALIRLVSTALAAAVSLPREGGPNFPKGIINGINHTQKLKNNETSTRANKANS